MDTIQMTEKDAERWETIVRLHSDDYADADDFWLEGIDELCSAFQPNKCDGCPVKSFTGRAYCGGTGTGACGRIPLTPIWPSKKKTKAINLAQS
jgi:hypothetical protein